MKRLKQVVLFYVMIFSTAIFIQSCCLGDHQITDSGAIVINEGLLLGPEFPVDTISGPFSVVLEPGLTLSDNFQDLGIVNSAYAITCDNPIENRIDLNTVELTLDKAITLDGAQIPGGTTLIGRQGVTIMDGDYSGMGFRLTVQFDQSFLDNVVFDSNRYDFTLKMSTDDQVDLEGTVSAFVPL